MLIHVFQSNHHNVQINKSLSVAHLFYAKDENQTHH